MSGDAEVGQAEGQPAAEHRDQVWRRGLRAQALPRGRRIGISVCLAAVLGGALLALASLPGRRPPTTLVCLYLSPADTQTVGADAPHPPTVDRLFGLTPANWTLPTAKTTTEPASADATPPDAKPAARPAPTVTDWRAAIARCTLRDQLVLHVSSLARVEHGHVYFYGRQDGDGQEVAIALADVLRQLTRSRAQAKLLVLDVHWPLITDRDGGTQRLQQLNEAILAVVRRGADRSCHVLLPSSGDGPARAMPGQPQSLMNYYLSRALATGHADADASGRTSLREAVQWAQPRIDAVARQLGAPQRMVLVRGGRDFILTIDQGGEASVQRHYPQWLAAAWQRRQQYCDHLRLPWLPDVARRWGEQLSYIESRWRRGETEAGLRGDALAAERRALADIDSALAQQHQHRLDSLRLAALRSNEDVTAKAQRAAETLLAQFHQIVGGTPEADREAAIKKAVDQYAASFAAGDSPLALDAILDALDDRPTIDVALLQLTSRVRCAWQDPADFAVTDAVDALLADPVDPRRAAQVLKLYRLQDVLGSDPAATGLVWRSAEAASDQLAAAQHLVWNPGRASRDAVDHQVAAALRHAATALAAQDTVASAIRRLQRITGDLQADRSLGVRWQDDQTTSQLRQRAAVLVAALQHLQNSSADRNDLADELAMVQQASESLQRQWDDLLGHYADAVRQQAVLPTTALSIAVDADARGELLSRTPLTDPANSLTADPATDPEAIAAEPVTLARTPVPAAASEDYAAALAAIHAQAADRYRHWWRGFIGQTRDIDAIPTYRRAARRNSVAGTMATMSVAVIGQLSDLDWNNPAASIQLHHRGDTQDTAAVRFEFLAPAAASLKVIPASGSLHPGERQTVSLTLVDAPQVTGGTMLTGVWLRLTRDQTSQLVSLPMPACPSRPAVAIDFGPQAAPDGHQAVLRLWPDTRPQPLQWHVTSNDPQVTSVVVALQTGSGASLTSAPIPLTVGEPAAIRFLPPKTPAAAALDASGRWTITATEPTHGTQLGQWQVVTELRDPRTMIVPRQAEFRIEPNGRNRLEVNVALRPASEPLDRWIIGTSIRLAADRDHIDRLIDCGASRLEATIDGDERNITLYADDLRFEEGGPVVASVPLAINGDAGYVELLGRFPRSSGTIQLQWNQRPELRVEAPTAVVPGTPLPATIRARNLQENAALQLEVLNGDASSGDVVWRRRLDAPRHRVVTIAAATDATLAVTAGRADWTVSVPTAFGTGMYRVRVATEAPVGADRLVAERWFRLDDAVPGELHAQARIEPEQTTVQVSMRPGPSGVHSVTVTPDGGAGDKPAQPTAASASDASGARWCVAWPEGQPLPARLKVVGITGAGKEFDETVELTKQTVATVGSITGRVLEGSIPQPDCVVTLVRADRSAVARVRTDGNGTYVFSVPPGQYQVTADKAATRRTASATVNVVARQTVTHDLHLRRAPY